MAALTFQLRAARSEISKLHRQMNALSRSVQRELADIRRQALLAAHSHALHTANRQLPDSAPRAESTREALVPTSPPASHLLLRGDAIHHHGFSMTPIGFIESCFVYRYVTDCSSHARACSPPPSSQSTRSHLSRSPPSDSPLHLTTRLRTGTALLASQGSRKLRAPF